jgi:hypothetical protein
MINSTSHDARDAGDVTKRIPSVRVGVTQHVTAPLVPELPILEGELIDLDQFPGQELAGQFDHSTKELDIYHEPVWPAEPTFREKLYHNTIEDPYWILMGLMVALPVGIVGTAVYGIVEIISVVATNIQTITRILVAVLIMLALLIFGAVKSGVCPGIHCGGCKG